MPARGGLDGVAEVLVEIGFTVVIQIVQARDLVAAEDEHLSVAYLQAEGLVEAGGETFPAQFTQVAVDAPDAPDVAVDGADERRAVGSEVHTGQEHQRLPGVVVGHGEGIDGEEVGVEAALAGGLEFRQPTGGAGFGEVGEIFLGSAELLEQSGGRFCVRFPGPEQDFCAHASRVSWKSDYLISVLIFQDAPGAAEEHDRLVRPVLKRHTARIRRRLSVIQPGIRQRLAGRAQDDDTRLLIGRAQFQRTDEQVYVAGAFEPGRFEHAHPAHAVFENDAFVVQMQPDVVMARSDPAGIPQVGRQRERDAPVDGWRLDQSEARRVEFEEPAGPRGAPRQSRRVEADCAFIVRPDFDRDPLGDGPGGRLEHRGKEPSDLGAAPAVVDPVAFLLRADVTIRIGRRAGGRFRGARLVLPCAMEEQSDAE